MEILEISFFHFQELEHMKIEQQCRQISFGWKVLKATMKIANF